jgi:glycosyltransferase involved in cell wall biosynthesis
MRLFFLAIGARDRASSRLRIWDHVAWFREQGHEVRAHSLTALGAGEAKGALYVRLATHFAAWLRDFLWADAIVVQEALLFWPALLFKNLGKRRRVVFDFSDPVDRTGAGWKRRLRATMFRFFIRRADVVIVENRSYLDLLRDRTAGIDHFYGPVDATGYRSARERLALPEPPPVRIGWTGSPGTYKFIRPLLPLIDELARERAIELVLIGVERIDHEMRNAKLTLVRWDERSEFDIVPTFDLGLFRLDETPDALWRGAGKLFIYMAAGVAFIASAKGIARDLMDESGVGFAVPEDADWLDVLRQALDGAAERQRMREQSLVFARERLAYEVYRQKLEAHLSGDAQGIGTTR